MNNPNLLYNSYKVCARFLKNLSAHTTTPILFVNYLKEKLATYKSESWIPVYSSEERFEGVFARNLGLNKNLSSPSCYGESLMMDNYFFMRDMQIKYFYENITEKIADSYFKAYIK